MLAILPGTSYADIRELAQRGRVEGISGGGGVECVSSGAGGVASESNCTQEIGDPVWYELCGYS